VAFDKKMREIFDWYIATYKKRSSESDKNSKDFFYSFTHDLDKHIKSIVPEMNGAMFIAKIFDELEYPDVWKPKYEDMLVFFDSLPSEISTKKWPIMAPRLKREDWGRYNKKYAKASFIESLGTDYIMLMREDNKKNLIFSVYLGDIRNKIGISDSDLLQYYDETYDVIEQEIGRDAVAKYLPDSIQVVDWPNASALSNAKYEFLVKGKKDPAIVNIQNKITIALNRLGL
jgi:hypothetical protein